MMPMNRGSVAAALLAALTAMATLCSPLEAQEESLEELAIEFMTLLMDGAFEEASARMAPQHRIAAEDLAAFWPQLQDRYGTLRRMGRINRITVNGLETVQLLGYFDRSADETTTRTIRVSFDAESRPTGFFILDEGGRRQSRGATP